MILMIFLSACEGDQEHLADAINEADSLAFMRSRGISTLISDSGVMRYKIVAEDWDIYTNTNPATWKFVKGLLMERFDKSFHTDLFVQADTAYFHQQRLWELRGRVVIKNIKDEVFRTEELFWDLNEHKIWSTKFMHILTPTQELKGTDFRSNETMTDYLINTASGYTPFEELSGTSSPETPADTAQAVESTTPTGQRPGRIMPTAPGKQSQEGHFKTH